MKSITPVVSVILLITMTLVAAGGAFFFINSNVADLQSSGSVDTYPGMTDSRLNLVSVTGSKAIVRNDGSSPVTDVVVFINGELLQYTLSEPILPGGFLEIPYNPRKDGEDLEVKIIYSGGQTQATSPASVNTPPAGFVPDPEPLNPPPLPEPEPEPEPLEPLMFNHISTGNFHSCAVLTNSSGVCWGMGNSGQLGDGEDYSEEPWSSNVSVFVSGDYEFSSISAGGAHSCAVLTNGSGVCWGGGFNGQLGDGSYDSSNVPIFVSGDYEFSSIIAGDYHSCGILVNGSGVCWGGGFDGQLGDGSYDSSNVVVFVSGDYEFSSISAGGAHSCAVLTNGSGVCWGNGNFGELGHGILEISNVPVFVSGDYEFSSISAGEDFCKGAMLCEPYQGHSCGVLVNGSGVCWGKNYYGRLGNESLLEVFNTPIFIAGNFEFSQIKAGNYHNCGLLINGSGVCWGYAGFGQLGDGIIYDEGEEPWGAIHNPVFVSGNYNFSSISSGNHNSCTVLINNSAVCWGIGDIGQLGDGEDYSEEPWSSNVPVFVKSG